MTTVKQLKMQYRNGIEDAMQRKGLTISDLAELSGYTPQTARNVVNRPQKVKVETMEEIWRLLTRS